MQVVRPQWGLCVQPLPRAPLLRCVTGARRRCGPLRGAAPRGRPRIRAPARGVSLRAGAARPARHRRARADALHTGAQPPRRPAGRGGVTPPSPCARDDGARPRGGGVRRERQQTRGSTGAGGVRVPGGRWAHTRAGVRVPDCMRCEACAPPTLLPRALCPHCLSFPGGGVFHTATPLLSPQLATATELYQATLASYWKQQPRR